MPILSAQPDAFVVLTCLFVVLSITFGLVLKKMKQPYIVSYILIGVFLGEYGIGMVENSTQVQHIGEIGIILLMFFIGLEIDLPDFVGQWRVAILGTTSQILLSVLSVLALGWYLDWGMVRIIVIGFVIALSSSAVIIKLLEDKSLMHTQLGKQVLSILLTQDILIVPLLIITTFLAGNEILVSDILYMLFGGLIILLTLWYVYKRRTIRLPLSDSISKDPELQVFLAILFCFGGALITSFFGLSAALGAFVGGIVMHAAKASSWIHDTLHSFRILFVAFFFVSIGLQLNLNFIQQNLNTIMLLVAAVYITNHFVNAGILRFFLPSTKEALYGGALLAQIGELSFLLSFSAYQSGIILEFGYQLTLSIICLTLLLSPFYIAIWERILTRPSSSDQ